MEKVQILSTDNIALCPQYMLENNEHVTYSKRFEKKIHMHVN
jgi:hypothetical protein